MKVIEFIMNQILGQTYILFALIALIGYLALKEGFTKAITGAIKTAIGVLVMGQGAGLMISTFNGILNYSIIWVCVLRAFNKTSSRDYRIR